MRGGRPVADSPLTTTPVITLMIGSAPSSFQRSGAPAGRPAQSLGSWRTMSSITGRRNSSAVKKCRTTA